MWARRNCLALAGCLLLAACGSAKPAADSAPSSTVAHSSTTRATAGPSSSSSTTSASTTTSTTAPAPTTAPVHLAVAETLQRISIQPSDLVSGNRINLYDDGDVVAGQVTLDVCGGAFPSEARRRARHQVGVWDQHGSGVGLSTEAVLYDSAAGAQQALSEILAAKAHCPTGFVPTGVAGEPPTQTTFGPAPDASWPATPGVTRVALAETYREQSGHSNESVSIYQVRGALLVGLYVIEPVLPGVLAPTSGGIEGVAHSIAGRLAALPVSALAPTASA